MAARFVTEAGFAAFFVLAILLDIAGRKTDKIPAFGQMITRAMRTRSGRVGVIAGWVWIGLHFFAR